MTLKSICCRKPFRPVSSNRKAASLSKRVGGLRSSQTQATSRPCLLEKGDELDALWSRIERLDVREQTILILRYGLKGESPLTLKEIGRRLGVTREWVRKIEVRAMRKLENRAGTGTDSAAKLPRIGPPVPNRPATYGRSSAATVGATKTRAITAVAVRRETSFVASGML